MSPVRVIFIAGTGRSGSTAVARYLQARTGAFHVGELRYIWDRGVIENQLCECGTEFRSCPFWSDVMKHAFGDALDLWAGRFLALKPLHDRIRTIPRNSMARAPKRHEAKAYSDTLSALYSAIATVSGSDDIIDSSKDPSYLFALRATQSFDIRVLHLVRDSRAVAFSWTRRRVRPEVHWKQEFMQTLPPWRSALSWLDHHVAIEFYKRRFGDGGLLRYEDFVTRPDSVIDWFQSSVSAVSQPPAATGRAERHGFSGNPMRFEEGPLQISLDQEWETQLGQRDRLAVSALTAPLLRRYGYPLW